MIAHLTDRTNGRAVVAFKGPVESLDDLFERAKLFRDRIFVGQPDHLADVK